MPPRRLQLVNERFRSGYLEESLRELRRVYDPKNPSDRVLMAELLIETDGLDQIRSLVSQYTDSTTINAGVRARACLTLAVALRRENRFSESVRLHEKAVHFASRSEDISVLCRANLLLLATKFELFGPASLGTLPRETWQSALSSGDPLRMALVHCYFAGFEGRRGAFDMAKRHLDLGRQHLENTDNPYVEGLLCNNSTTLAAISADPLAAIDYAEKTLKLTERSGDRYTRISAVNNLCHISLMLGRVEDAQKYLTTAECLIRNEPFLRMCLYESRAHIELLSGRLTECEATLDALASLSNVDLRSADQSYSALEVAVIHVRLLRKLRKFDMALEMARLAAAAAHDRHLPLLEAVFTLHCSDALVDLDQKDDAAELVGRVAKMMASIGSEPLTVRAELERVRARILGLTGHKEEAAARFALSIMMHDAAGQTEARDEAVHCRDETMARSAEQPASRYDPEPSHETRQPAPQLTEIELAANLFAVANRADLLALMSYELLSATGVASRIAVIAGGSESESELIRHKDWPTAARDEEAGHSTPIDLGTHQGKSYRLLIEPCADVPSMSRLAALETIIRASVERERATRERLERTSVWPVIFDNKSDGLLCASPRMREIYNEAKRVAGSDLTVLLTGETGVGKEVLAREIHRLSKRAMKDFRPVVCAGIASSVLESQLFGYRKGSFTGAVLDFPGVIRGAQGGTIFLDEIGELTPDLQIKLLRFLESREVHGLGELKPEEVDVRVIAATNADLAQLIEDRRFREDLHYRLGVAVFNIPPLRERREEIPWLIEHFLERFAQQNRKVAQKISDEALEHLMLYSWPGNIRQLRNEMERLSGILDAGTTIRASDLKPEIVLERRVRRTLPGPNELVIRLDQELSQATEEVEREMIRRVLNGYKGSLEAAARALGLTRKGLYHKRQRLGML